VSGRTRAQVLRATRDELASAAIEEAALDARILVSAALGVDTTALVARPDTAVEPETEALLRAMIVRRIGREPVSRILGEWEFWSLPFRLSPDTLVPRPDTETVVEAALAAFGDRERRARILDLGTGSGCILVALLSELPQAEGTGVDRSFGALATARLNARRHGVADRAAFVLGDWSAAIGGRFDLIVSNPPYVDDGAMAGLAAEVRCHDPPLALRGGPDGLAAYRVILHDAVRLLRPSGLVVVEIGHDQAAAVSRLAGQAGLELVEVRRDLAGCPRAIVAALA
jgi:release factor glutamine methyltransferase